MTDNTLSIWHSMRPVRVDLSTIFDEIFVIDKNLHKPVLTKDECYEVLKKWQQEQGLNWEWKQSNTDPIGEVARTRLPKILRPRVDTRLQVAYERDARGKKTQQKKRAFRFIRLSAKAQRIRLALLSKQPDEDPIHMLALASQHSNMLARTNMTRMESRDKANATLSLDGDSFGTVEADKRQTRSAGRRSMLSSSELLTQLQDFPESPNSLRDREARLPSEVITLHPMEQQEDDLDFFIRQSSPESEQSIVQITETQEKTDRWDKSAVYVLELYAHPSCPACTFAHKAKIGTIVRTLAIDWNTQKKEVKTAGPHSDHQTYSFDLNNLRFEDIKVWAHRFWGITPERIDWVHSSPECKYQSLACAVNKLHRSASGAPKTWEAQLSDKAIANNLEAMQQIISLAPKVLCTMEHPLHSTFDSHPNVRVCLTRPGWQLVFSSHCKAASESLDGKVTANPNCKALFPQKNTIWLTFGLPPYAQLPKCAADCRMLVPGQKVHRLLICNPSEHALQPGQRVMRSHEGREAIPLGAMAELWDLHQQIRKCADDAHYKCTICGSESWQQENRLMICDTPECGRVQHMQCSGLKRGTEIPKQFWCDTCKGSRDLTVF